MIALIDNENVIETLADHLRSHWTNIGYREYGEENDPEVQAAIEDAIRKSNIEFGNKQAAQLKDGLRETIALAEEILKSDLYMSVKTLRDRNLAHTLTETFWERDKEVSPMKYGHERELLERTISIIQNLYLWVNGADFDIAGECRELAQKRASEFWNNISFRLYEAQ